MVSVMREPSVIEEFTALQSMLSDNDIEEESTLKVGPAAPAVTVTADADLSKSAEPEIMQSS